MHRLNSGITKAARATAWSGGTSGTSCLEWLQPEQIAALGVIRGARDAGKKVAVIADETRPFLQGLRLTAWELAKDDIPVTVITDNMAGHVMKNGKVDAVVVGADRIAANGDTANKIGTYMVAVLAREHGVPFYVAAPLTTLDLSIASGEQIPIEERDSMRVLWIGPLGQRDLKREHSIGLESRVDVRQLCKAP